MDYLKRQFWATILLQKIILDIEISMCALGRPTNTKISLIVENAMLLHAMRTQRI